jgi:putative transposase
MKAAGLGGKVRRRFKVTTDSKHDQTIAPNILSREFEVETVDSVWTADISYVRTLSGWVYLTVILDLATRLVVGWSMASHMRTELISSALMNALS